MLPGWIQPGSSSYARRECGGPGYGPRRDHAKATTSCGALIPVLSSRVH